MTTPSQVKRNKTHIIKKNVQVKMSMSNLDKGTNIQLKLPDCGKYKFQHQFHYFPL